MKLQFPEGFIIGTSTAAYQIETASDNNWKGLKCKDGTTFDQCSQHDLHRDEDLEYICQLGNAYRMSHDWAKLQHAPFADFDQKEVDAYLKFMEELKRRGKHIMLVLHHFTNPTWFEKEGSWEKEGSRKMWLDFVQKSVDTFGHLVDTWNTFNEPNVYVSNGWITGEFPPFKKGKILLARKVLKEISKAHEEAYDIIKQKSKAPIGISFNTVQFKGEVFPGQIFAKIFDWWFNEYCHNHFLKVDFQGLSYYAKMSFRPFPLDNMNHTEQLKKLGRRTDLMWEIDPSGFYNMFQRYWKKTKKPIIITESGICTHDPKVRKESIKEYLGFVYKAQQEGIPIQGYFHWSTMDNHEWNIGQYYRFGLVSVDFATGKRTMTEAGTFLGEVARNNFVEV